MSNSTLADILQNCEKNMAPPYVVNPGTYKTERPSLFHPSKLVWTEPIAYSSGQEDIFIVSDLHIASGRNSVGVYKGTENFFADEAFSRFLSEAKRVKKSTQAILVINGDIFDFLRTTEYPGKIKKRRLTKSIRYFFKYGVHPEQPAMNASAVEDEYTKWSEALKACGISKTPGQLASCISKNEKEYGLQTNDYKTIYKLMCIKRGHPVFFTALAQWLNEGNKIIIVKGNHDLELYWPAVRNYLRLILAEDIVQQAEIEQVLMQKVLPNMTFVDDAVVIDNSLFIEHGHRFDKFTMVLSSPVLTKAPGQINIPFGSFFNRYLINKLELFYPDLDKVRPAANIMPMLVRENFPFALKILFRHIPFMLRILTTNLTYVWYMFNRVVWWMLILLIPLALIGYKAYAKIEAFQSMKTGFVTSLIEGSIKSIAILILGYFLSRVVAWLQLEEPSSLSGYAKIKFKDKPFKYVVMGHTHNPEACMLTPACTFFNTGTWIPVIENSTAEVREDRMYTFLHFSHNEQQALTLINRQFLQRWNDDAVRADAQVIIKPKE